MGQSHTDDSDFPPLGPFSRALLWLLLQWYRRSGWSADGVLPDARKFIKMGIWRSFIRVLLIILHVEFRLPVLPQAFFQDIR